MKKKGIAEPVAAYAVTTPDDPLAESTKLAHAILDAAGIKAVDIVDEELEDEYCAWVNRIFYIDTSVQEAVDLTVKLAEEESKKDYTPVGNAVVMFMPAR